MVYAAPWMLAFALGGFLVLVTFGRRLGEPVAGWVGTIAIVGAFAMAVVTWIGLLSLSDRSVTMTLFDWLPLSGTQIKVAILVDPLSVTMVLFVTGVSALIHLYSIGYMHRERDFTKFFVYMNLFVFRSEPRRPALGHHGPVRHRGLRADPPVLDRLHASGARLHEVLRVHEPLRLLDAPARPRQQPARDVRGLGGRRRVLVLARLLLLRPGQRRVRRQEGLRLQTDPGRRDAWRDVCPVHAPAHAHVPGHRQGRAGALGHRRDVGRARAALRCRGQVGPDPVVQLAPRRDGGPHAGLGADPRRHDGDRGGVPAVPDEPRPGAFGVGTGHDRDRRRRHRVRRRTNS